MIRCVWAKNPFDPYQRERWIEPWSDRATLRNVIPSQLSGFDPADLRVKRNGLPIQPEAWDFILGPDDLVEISLAPQGPGIFAAAHAAGSIAAAEAATTTVAATVQGALINIAISTALAALVGVLFRQKPPKPGEKDSPTYGFGGVSSNPAYDGAAFPLVFGEMRVAGPIINLYTDVFSGADEYINILMMVAGHEVQSIGGIEDDDVGQPFTTANEDLPVGLEIDGEPADNFNEVECYVRLGKTNQELIPGFAAPVLQYAIEREIRESVEPSAMEQSAGVYDYDDSEITVWDTPVGVTTEVEADAFTLLIRFPGGLYALNSDSTEPKLRTVRFQVRYRRAKNGSPLGKYVVLPAFDVVGKKTQPFSFAYSRDFLDPASYVEPSPGYYLDVANASNDCAYSSATALSATAAADIEMTVIAWVKLENYFGDGVGGFDTTNRVLSHQGSNRGFLLSLIGGTPQIGSGDNTAITIRISLGNGSSSTNFTTDDHAFLNSALAGEWAMIGITYRADVSEDGSGELAFYCNGKHIQTKKVTTAQRMVWPTSSAVVVGAASTTGAQSIDGSIDEVLIYERALTDIEMGSKYQGGAPEATLSSDVGILAGWHFDETNTGGTTTPDFVGSVDLTLNNGALISSSNTGTDTGPVYQAASGNVLRDRFLVEIQRITDKDEADFAAEDAQLGAVQLRIYEEFEYPGQALLAVRLRASGQTNGVPSVTVPVRGYKDCPVWDGMDSREPVFTRKWTRNPAWIAAAAATDTKLGAGQIWSVNDIDWTRFGEAADYYDTLVAANDERDEDDEPSPLYITIYDITLSSASTATGLDAVFVDGLVQFDIDDGDWPETYPGVFPASKASIASEDAEIWFRVVGVDVTGVPQEIRDLEGLKLPLGRVGFDTTGGGPGGGGGSGSGGFTIWCHTPSDPGSDETHTPATGEVMTLDRWERQMECDITFDRTDLPRWDALLTILKSARSTPLPQGRKLSMWFDAPRDVDNTLGMGQTVSGSFRTTYSGVADRPNVIEGTFLDRDRGYEQVPVQLRHPTVVNPSVLTDQRIARESFEGITRRSQLFRYLRYKLNWYHLARRMVEIAAGPDHLETAPGFRLRVSNDVTGWAYSGRLYQASANTTTVYLDQSVTLETGTTYQIMLRDSGVGSVETLTVTSSPGTYDPGDALTVSTGYSWTPQKDDSYLFGEQNKVGMDYLVIETGLNPQGLVRTIKGVQYDSQIYDDAWGTLPSSVSYLTPPEAS